MTDKNILSGRQIRIGSCMLINGSNAMLQRDERVGHDDLFTIENDFTAVRLMDTRQYFDKSRFPCTVFPYNCMDFTFFQIETDVVKCFYARKDLGDMIHFEQVFRHLHPSRRVVYDSLS